MPVLLLFGSLAPFALAKQQPLMADTSFVQAAHAHLYDAHGPIYLTGLN